MKMKTIYIAAIAEYDHDSGEMFNTICTGTSQNEVVGKVKEFFNQEKAEGHDVPGLEFEDFADLTVSVMDSYRDREYYIETSKLDIPSGWRQ